MRTLLDVNIISKETIKPSSPTPPHLKTLKLSLVDQQEPPLALSITIFFAPSSDLQPRAATARLKKTLPEMLTLFYPLAGRVTDNQYFDCNDQGISLFETRVGAPASHVLSNPLAEDLLQLLPVDNFSGAGPKVLLAIQINVFECGGVALGLRMSHKLGDAFSFMSFIHTWAAITRGGDADIEVVPPKFGTATLFPSKHVVDVPHAVSPPFDAPVKLVSKSFVFSAANIAALRAKCSNTLYTPTRVEAVTAFLWSCEMKAAQLDSSVLLPAMNLRTRMDPPLAGSHFGNIILGLMVTSTTKGTPPELECLAHGLHREFSKVDGDYVAKLQEDNGILALYDSYREVLDILSSKGGVSQFGISSCCRFPLYEADFGWGKPDWVTFVNLNCENLTFLTDTKCGTGIQAWVTLNEKLMSRFECDPDLVAFTSNT